jgi:hypothetical protein
MAQQSKLNEFKKTISQNKSHNYDKLFKLCMIGD